MLILIWSLFLSIPPAMAADSVPGPNSLEERESYFSRYSLGFPAEPDQPEGSIILPQGRPFPSLLSDPRDLRLGLRKTSQNKIEADVGGYRSVYGWKGKVANETLVFHTGIEGNAYFTMRKQGMKFPLESSDGLFGLYAEAIRGEWLYQVRFTHISAHLSDGSPDVTRSISYSREFFVLRAARQIDWVRPYAALIALVNSSPDDVKKIGAQLGFYAIPRIKWGLVHPYFGSDFRIFGGKEGNTLNLAAGIALISELGAPPIRLAFHYLTGNDLRGQFFNQRIRKFSGGLELDF